VNRVLIASDWHLGTYSAPEQERLALAFLHAAREAGDTVILNGDIFEGLFEPAERAERAHPVLSDLIEELTRAGILQRIEGNHDPGAGHPRLVFEHPAAGRVLVTHGHQVDPVHDSRVGNFGDGISRRFGRLTLVRGAARVAEAFVATTMATRVDRMYRRRCLAMVEQAGCTLGVFGHNHRRHLVPGDPYANAGALRRARLEYLTLDASGVALRDFSASPAAGGRRVASW
jgi:UDP-2,3-diacylglucosamine pyrophosphatase LpxH